MRRVPAVLLLLLGLPIVVGHASPRAQPPPAPGRDVAAIYTELCANCHGATLAGGPAPSLVDDDWAHGADDDSVTRSIREGWPATGMPPFQAALSDQEVRTLVIYLREMKVRAATPAASAPRKPATSEVMQSEKQAFRLETVVDNLDTPWGLEFLPDGDLLFTERNGQLRRVTGGRLNPIVVGGLPSFWVRQDGGLFDVAAHPDYASNGWLYFAFSETGGSTPGSSSTRVIRARLRDNMLVDQETLFKAAPALYWDDNSHYGARFLFDAQKFLYFSIGDRGHMADAQDLASPYGKLHRIHDDGRVPADNPFVDRPAAVKSVWSYGHRNQQGLAFHPVTGDLWTTEHGPRGGDEINLTVRRPELWMAGDHVRDELRRHADHGEDGAGRDGAAGRAMDADDCAQRHCVLHRRSLPGLEAQPVHGVPGRPAAAPAGDSGIEGGSPGSDLQRPRPRARRRRRAGRPPLRGVQPARPDCETDPRSVTSARRVRLKPDTTSV